MHEALEDWLPTPPQVGPPLPKWLGIYWPWYSPTTVIQAEIQLSNLTISHRSVFPGEAVNISVTVANIVSVVSSANIILKINGSEYAREAVALNPGEGREIAFEIVAPNEVGVANVEVDGLQGSFVVQNPEPGSGSIRGVISDASTKRPVAGATVAVLDKRTTTDGNGNYYLPNIQPVPQRYVVAVIATGYEIARVGVQINEGENHLDLSITPLPPLPPAKLVFTASALPNGASLWSGYLKDIESGVEQGWGVQRIEQRVEMNPLSGKKGLFRFLTNGDVAYGPYLVELPSPSGEYVWTGHAFNAGSSTNLASTNNKQILRGVLTGQDYAGGVAWLTPDTSVEIPGYYNIGQYFIGQNLQIYVPIPLQEFPFPPYQGGYLLYVGQRVECEAYLKNKTFFYPGGQVTVPVWQGNYIRGIT